jgi:ketosteroid isomerase-like protein
MSDATEVLADTPVSSEPMGSTPREVAERLLAAVGAFLGDPESPERAAAITDLFVDQPDWFVPGDVEHVPWAGSRTDKLAILEFYRQLSGAVIPEKFDLRAVVAEGDRVVVIGELAFAVRSTGKLIQTEFALDITVREGRVVRYHVFEDTLAVIRAILP